MKLELSDKQSALLKEVLEEYSDECYQSMFDYSHMAVDAEDEAVKKEYQTLAAEEERRFTEVKKLRDYIGRYESLMRDAE